MTRPIIPIARLDRRIPEAGRIRIGVKTANAMKAIGTFRFTSHDKGALEQVAAAYGGTVKPWSDPKAAPNQHEVITEADEIRIVLPPDPLSGSPVYELWGGGGCERRCDGVTCTVIAAGPDGPEPSDVDCLCVKAGELKCDPHTRLNVILPDVRFTGVWRLESKSWNVAHEFPGFVDLICSLQERGLTRGVLRLEHRTSVTGGKTRKFVVPVLGVDESMDALAAGAASVGSLGTGSRVPALAAGSSEGTPAPPAEEPDRESPPGHVPSGTSDDEVVDAVLVDESPARPPTRACVRCGGDLTDGRASVKVEGGRACVECPSAAPTLTARDIGIVATKAFPVDDEPRGQKTATRDRLRYALTYALTNGERWHTADLTTADMVTLATWLENVAAKRVAYTFDEFGVTFTLDGKDVTVLWTSLEPEAVSA